MTSYSTTSIGELRKQVEQLQAEKAALLANVRKLIQSGTTFEVDGEHYIQIKANETLMKVYHDKHQAS